MNRRPWMIAVAIVAAACLGFGVGRCRNADPAPGIPLIGIASLDNEAYIRAIRESGGIPVVLPNTDASPAVIAGYLERLDGLLLPGGADIPPSEYGEQPHPTVEPLDPQRFNFEKSLGKAWIEQTDKPLLGICLGSQWINVLHGGPLVQDIPSEFHVNHRGTTHRIELVPGSRLAAIYGESGFEVNSWHHQAVREPGHKLRVAARSPDGVIEATETTDGSRFLIGVQWHPEKMLPADPRQTKLFRAFIEAASPP